MLIATKYPYTQVLLGYIHDIILMKSLGSVEVAFEEVFGINNFGYHFEHISELSIETMNLILEIDSTNYVFAQQYWLDYDTNKLINDPKWKEFVEKKLDPFLKLIIDDFKRAGFETQHLDNWL
jgi:hypothetical protein